MKFQYKARSKIGDLIKGDIEAESADKVASQLMSKSLIPISIEETIEESNALDSLNNLLKPKKVNSDELVIFTRQMYSLIRSGVPIVRSLNSLSQSTKNEYFSSVLRNVSDEIESGRNLSSAFSNYLNVFPAIFVSTVRVGEDTGRLDETLNQLSEYMETEEKSKKQLKSALRYPTIVIIAMLGAIGVINVLVIPAFSDVFKSFGADLPIATKILLAFSSFTLKYWPHIIGCTIGAMLLIRYWLNTSDGRYMWDYWKLKIPLFGNLILRGTLGRLTRSLGLAFQSGIPLLQGLGIVVGTINNAYLEECILNMRDGIENGETLTRTATAAGIFTPLVLQMIAIGEETGSLDSQLLETSAHYEREIEYELKTIGESIEPIIVVALGIMVLILAMGIFLPMWELSNSKNI